MSVSQGFKSAIEGHLRSLAAADTLFAETLKKPAKNINDCCTYIVNEVKKKHKGNTVAMADEEVYNMAVHYYDEDDIVVGKSVQASASHSSDAKAKMIDAIASRDTQPSSQVKQPVKKMKPIIANQPSLF